MRISSPSGASRRRSRSTCTSSALRVGAPSGQARLGEHIARDHRAEAVEQRPGERLLDRRQRHPRVVMAQEPVVVERGTNAVRSARGWRRPAAGVERRFGRAGRDPVLEAIGRDGGSALVGHEQETGNARVAQLGQSSADRSGQRTSSTFMRAT